MFEDHFPVEWVGGRAVVALPEHIGVPNAGQVREVLLSVINRGATTLIADMTATISCDHAGADALIRAWRRAVSSGTELYLVVTAQIVSRVLDLRGLDRRLVSIYPSLEAAIAASPPVAAPPGESRDAFQDAMALKDSDGTITAAGPITLTVIREVTGAPRFGDLDILARDAAAAEQKHLRFLDRIVTGIFSARLSLQAAADLPADVARCRVEAVLDELDDIIREIRSIAFAARDRFPPAPSGDDG